MSRELERPVHPFLAATYSVIAVAATSGGELVRPADGVRPLLVALAVTAAAWIVAGQVSRDPHRRGAVTLIAVIVFATYGYWRAFFEGVPVLNPLAQARVLVPVSAIALALTAWAASRPGQGAPAVTRYLNAVSAILIVIAGASLVWQRTRTLPIEPARPAELSGAPAVRPHIYLLVLDKYTGSRSLREHYGYDNSAFERFLTARGFEVARHARANYVHTFLALASMLNWEYLDRVVDQLGPNERRWFLLYPMIEDNRTVRALKAAGYRFVFMPSGFSATAANRFADQQMPLPSALTREFEAVWMRTTILDPIVELWCRYLRCPNGFMLYASDAARTLDWKFDQLGQLARATDPLFILAHLTVPHEPYVYAADCRHVPPFWPTRDDGSQAGRVKRAYIDQLRCVNRKIERVVTAVQRTSTRPVVIALQSDHGHGRFGVRLPDIGDAPAAGLEERLDIFAAYYLPGAPSALVNDSIGPINAVRAILRQYLDLPLPPLAEASYWSSDDQPYRFVPVP